MDPDELLRQDWESMGRVDDYESQPEQESRDITDRRHRKRGEQAQSKRLKRNRQKFERERAAAFPTTSDRALPHYLIGRDELEFDAEMSSKTLDSGDDWGDEEERLERRVDNWSQDAAAQDARWEQERLAAKAQRAREAAGWDAAHGAERDEQHAGLTAERPDCYWALDCPIGRKPKWQLRLGACLETDATAVMADDEQLLLYRSFRNFSGNVLKAVQARAPRQSQHSSTPFHPLPPPHQHHHHTPPPFTTHHHHTCACPTLAVASG